MNADKREYDFARMLYQYLFAFISVHSRHYDERDL